MTITHYLLVCSIFWSVFCRARHMSPATPVRYKVQHGIVLLLSMMSLPIFGLDRFAPILLGLAVCVYLWFDALDWRAGHYAPQPAVPSSMDMARAEFRGLTTPPKF